jgi:hypothetical protein
VRLIILLHARLSVLVEVDRNIVAENVLVVQLLLSNCGIVLRSESHYSLALRLVSARDLLYLATLHFSILTAYLKQLIVRHLLKHCSYKRPFAYKERVSTQSPLPAKFASQHSQMIE